MKTSTERILTTHVGSLPRPQDVVDLLFAQDRGEPVDQALFDSTMKRGVADAIQKVSGVVDVLDGIQNNISGPAVTFIQLDDLKAFFSIFRIILNQPHVCV